MYILLILLILLILFCGIIVNSKRIIILFVFFILAIFSGFRYNVGIDYQNYMDVYHNILHGADSGIREPGYNLLVKGIISIGGTQQSVFLIFAFITQILFCKYLLYNIKDIRDRCLAVLIYVCIGPFFLASMSGIRQYLAIALFAYSFKFIQNRQFLKYFITLSLGAYFAHLSLFLMLPFYFLLNKKLSLKIKIVVTTSVVFLNKLLLLFISKLGYAFYLQSSLEYTVNITVYVFMLISFLLMFFENRPECVRYKFFFNLNFVSFLMLLLIILNRGITADIFLRINNYFFIGIIVLIPILLSSLSYKKFRFLVYSFFILFLLGYYVRNTVVNGVSSGLAPYNINLEMCR